MMSQASDNYRQLAKMLTTLNKRSAEGAKQCRSTHNSRCSTSSTFSLFNNLQNIAYKYAKPSQTSLKKTPKYEKELTKTRMTTAVSVIDFDRPYTCGSKSGNPRKTLKKYTKIQSSSLFNLVKQEKLALLQQQKQHLINQIFNQQKPVIHRIDEDQENTNKPNAINLRTYFSLNKLMDLKEKINHTMNFRPKTGGDGLKRIKQTSLFI